MLTGLKLKALSAQVGNMDCIQCLLNHKADVDARDKTKKTALRLAAIDGYKNCYNCLLEHSTDVCAEDDLGNLPSFYSNNFEK